MRHKKQTSLLAQLGLGRAAQAALALAFFVVLGLAPHNAFALNKVGCGTTGNEPCADGLESAADPVKTAMMTLPDALAKWRNCYRDKLKDQTCSPRIAAAQCESEIVAMGYSASQTSEMLRYNIMGIYGAECIGNFRKYIQTIQDAAKTAHLGGLSGINILATAIVDKILDAVISQILNNLTNQICNVTNQLTQAADSFVKNAICLPNASLNPFNFNLNIKELQCNGFAINPLTGLVNGSPINGVNVPITNIYNSGAVTDPTTGTSAPINVLQTGSDPITVPTQTLDGITNTVPDLNTQ